MQKVGRAFSSSGGYMVRGVARLVRMIPTAIIRFRVGLVNLITLCVENN